MIPSNNKEPQEEMCINWHIIELDAKMPALGRNNPFDPSGPTLAVHQVDDKPILPDGRKIPDFELPWPIDVPDVTGKEPIFVGLYSS